MDLREFGGDRDTEGVKSPKIRSGVEYSEFLGPLKLTLFYRDLKEKMLNLGLKSPSFREATFRASSAPPLALNTF